MAMGMCGDGLELNALCGSGEGLLLTVKAHDGLMPVLVKCKRGVNCQAC